MSVKQNHKKQVLKHLGNVSVAILSASLLVSSALAVDSAEAAFQVIGAESEVKASKKALNAALKIAKSTLAMSTVTAIVCLACIPAAGVAASPGCCVACGILIAKTFG